MDIKKFLYALKGPMTWGEFHKLTGINQSSGWRMGNTTYPVSPEILSRIYKLAYNQDISLSRKEIGILLLGRRLAGSLPDLDMLLAGNLSMDRWLTMADSQMSRAKILGLHYSTIFHRRKKIFRHFWPKKAVEIARRSSYQIDLFDLLGVNQKTINNERKV